MEYLRQNDKERDKKSYLKDQRNVSNNGKKVKRTTMSTISLLDISSSKEHVSNNNSITLKIVKSEKYERRKRARTNNNSRPIDGTLSSSSSSSSSSSKSSKLSTTSQSTIQENYQYLSDTEMILNSNSISKSNANSNLNSQSNAIQQDNQNDDNVNKHIRVRKSLLNINNKQPRNINHYSHPSSQSSQSSTKSTSSQPTNSPSLSSLSSPSYSYLKFDNFYNNINENFNHLENYDNIVYSTMELECLAGYDGGLPQQFYLEAYDSKTKKLRLNVTSIFNDVPLFRIDLAGNTGLDSIIQ